MVGILIATHGDFAAGLLHGAEMIIGRQAQCGVLSLCQGDDIALFGASIRAAVRDLDTGQGVLILTDLFSASPYNQVTLNHRALLGHGYRLVSGVNLPMLLEAIGRRVAAEPLDRVADAAMAAGQDGIRDLFVEMKKTGTVMEG